MSGFLPAFEAYGHGLDFIGLDGKTVRALLECPHLKIEIWGTRFLRSESNVGHPSRMCGAPRFLSDLTAAIFDDIANGLNVARRM